MIWLSLIFPVITIGIVYKFWSKKMHMLEAAIIMVVPIIFIAVSKIIVEKGQTRDTEYWGGWIQQTEHFEDWNEYVHRMCTRQNCSGSGKTRVCTTEVYDCSYVSYHPEYWEIDTKIGSFGVTQQRYKALAKKFGNETFVDLNRHYHTNDGDKYVSIWPGERETLESVTAVHTYENRTQVSDSVYKFPDVDPKRYGLFEYPAPDGNRKQDCIIGARVSGLDRARKSLDYWNAILGPAKQARVFFILFQGKPQQAGFDQQFYWKNGNKNEMNIVIGLGDRAIEWCHVFSWSEKEDLKVDIKSEVMDLGSIDKLPEFIEWLGPEMKKRFVRKRFREFSYLTVEPPLWYVITTLFVVVLICFLAALWAVKNDVQHYHGGYYR